MRSTREADARERLEMTCAPHTMLLADLWRRQPMIAAVNLVVGGALALSPLSTGAGWAFLLWLALLMATQGLRLWAWGRWHRLSAVPGFSAWRGWLVVVSGLTGLSWGLVPFLPTEASSRGTADVLPFLLAGVTAGSVTVLSAHPQALATFLAAALGPYTATMVVSVAPGSGWAAAVVLLYAAGLVAAGHHLRRARLRQARLYREHDPSAATENDACTALDARVHRRTAALEEANAVLAEEVHRLRQSEQRVRESALLDPLTGLPNRALLVDRLGMALDRARRTGSRVAVALVDVDRFKLVNDTLGHLAGDEVLRRLVHRLRGAVRASDTLARFGGDEFVAVFADLDAVDDAVTAADRLHVAARRVDGDGSTVDVTLSIGLAVFPEQGETIDDLLSGADIALHHAKVRGRARTEVLKPALVDAFRTDRVLADAWREAVGRGDVDVLCVPRRRVSDDGLSGLFFVPAPSAAWDGAALVAVARSGGFLRDLEWAVLESALAADVGDHSLTLGMQMSRETLTRPELVEQTQALLERHGVAPERLELSLDEETWLSQVEAGIDPAVRRLRAIGVRFAVDRFGAGRMAFRILRDAPIDVVRLAADMYSGNEGAAGGRGVMAAIAAMARARGLDVVLTDSRETEAPEGTTGWFVEEGRRPSSPALATI